MKKIFIGIDFSKEKFDATLIKAEGLKECAPSVHEVFDKANQGTLIGPTVTTGIKYGFHWTTAAGGGGSISNDGTPDYNVEKAINKARKEEYEYRQWFNDFNNMIGDVSNGFYKFGPMEFKDYAKPINNIATGANMLFNYGAFPFKIANNNFDDVDMRNLYVNAMGDAGAYIGAFAGGAMMTSAFVESGPGAVAAGTWGAIMGAQVGRRVFGYIGNAYYDVLIIFKINKQLEELNNYNRIHYPIIYP